MENIDLDKIKLAASFFRNIYLDKCNAFKKGGMIKKENRGLFTRYCGGNVTLECINRGKRSSDPKIRKRAVFAENARKWKH